MLNLYIASHTILYNEGIKPGTLQPTPDSQAEENCQFSAIYTQNHTQHPPYYKKKIQV